MKKLILFVLSVMMLLPVMVNAQFTATFGTGTSTTSTGGATGAPMSYGGAYSYAQQIYRAAEFTAAGVPAGAVITSIWFYNATGATTMSDLRTYLGPRSSDYFSSTTDWVPYNTLTLVDSGDWVTTGIGWFEIQLDQPYIWDGVSNLVVGVSFRGAHSDYSTNNPNCGYQYTVQSGNAALRRYSTSLASCDPTSTAAASTNSTNRPNLKISYILSNCPSLTPMVANIGPYSADLNWMNYNQSALSFDLVYGEASTFDTLTSTTITGLTDTFYALTGLTSATTYKASIKSHCSSESGTWSAPRTFTTLAACPTPTQLTVGTVTADQVTVSWYPGATETSWELVYVPHGSPVTAGTSEYPTSYPYTVYNLNDDTQYDIYVRASCGNGEWSYWTSPVTFTTDPLCTPPSSVAVSQIRGNSALVTWNSALVGADSYTVEYSELNMNNWVPATVSATQYMLSGLTPQTHYEVRVFSNCLLGDADTVVKTFTTGCLAGGDIAIGNGTDNSSYVPSFSCYNYSLTEQLFTASEIGSANMLYSISIQCSTVVSSTRTLAVYLMPTTQSSLTGFVNVDATAQKVFDGAVNITAGNWFTIPFDSAFAYDGSSNLILVVYDKTGSYNCSNYYYTHTSSHGNSYYVYRDDSPYDPTTATSYSSSSTTSRNNVKFGGPCDLTITCVAPNAYVTDVTESSITVDWVAGNNESSWQMEYSTNGTTWTPEGSVTAPYTLTNLSPNTDYKIRLRSDCGGSDTSSWTMVQAHTPCASENIPLLENFESATASGSGNMVDCWTTLSNYTSTHYPYTSSSQHHSGTYSVYFYGTSAYHSILVSPRLDDAVQMNNLEVSFWAYKTSANYYIQVGVMTDPNDPSTFVQVGSNMSPTATSTWEQFDVNTALYAGQGQYIAFRVPQDIANYMYIDDINIHTIPTCPHVNNIHTVANTVTTSSADLAWTAGGTESEWIVVYGVAGSITNPDNMLANATTVYTPSISLTGLSGGTQYDVCVKGLCSYADSSQWRQYSFRTECGISTLPFSENFESYAASSGGAITCYTRSSTYSPSTYPYVSTSYSTSGTKSLYFYTYTNSTYSTYSTAFCGIVLPQLDPSIAVNTLEMSLKMRTANVTTGKLVVGVMTNPSDMSTFTAVQTLTASAANTFVPVEVDFSSYTGSGSYIAIRTSVTSSTAIYVDDIYLNVAATCKRPVNVEVVSSTDNSATINWTARNAETDWQVVVVPHGQPVTSGTPDYATSHPYTVQGLTDATIYDVYVKADCGGGDESDWSEVVSFHTKCLPTNVIPYTEGFEGVGTGNNAYPVCWTKKSTYTSNTCPYVSSSYHSAGAASLYFYMPSGYYMYACSQGIDVSSYAPGDLAISVKLMAYSGLSYARMDVGVMTDPDDINTLTVLKSVYPSDFTALNQWKEFSIPLTQSYTTPIYITLSMPTSSTTSYMYVDEVKLDYAPTCSAPTNVAVSNIAGTSALVTWDDAQYGTPYYYVEYLEQGQSNWVQSLPITGNSYMLSGLTPQTTYQLKVYSDCATNDIVTKTFTTGCLAGGDLTIGNGTTTSYLLPLNNFYNYTYSQQIFLASEMNGPATIQSIAFDYAYSTSMTAKTNVSIYLGHTTQSTFSSSSNYVPLSNLTLVYSGSLNCHQGWNTFTLTTPFQYNGTSNLVLAVDDNSGSYNSSSDVFHVHSTGSYRSLYFYSDSYNPDPSNPTSAGASSSYTNGNRNNVRFGTPCDSLVTCVAPNVYISAYDHESIEVTWAPGMTESAWVMEYKAANDATWTQVPSPSSPTQLTNLNSGTLYTIRLHSDCGSGDTSNWVTLAQRTECTPQTLPLIEHFDGTTAGTGVMVPCWTRNTNGSTAYPYLSTSYHASGNNSVYFYATSSYYSYVATPRFDDNVQMDSLQIRFKVRKTATSPYFIEVGVMSDPQNVNTFVPVGTFAPTSTTDFEDGEVLTSGYSGTGHYVAFRCPQWITNYVYLDDVNIDYIPNCLHVNNVHATPATITATSATVVWTPGGSESEWEVVYGPAGTITNPELATSQTIYTTPEIQLSGLTGNTLYEVFVKANCDNGESSTWETGTFRTACVAISSLPYMENFDSYTGATTTSVSVNNLPACWDHYNHGTSSSYSGYPIIYTSTGTNYASSGVNAIRFYTYTTAGTYDNQVAILPQVDVTTNPVNTLKLSFDARANNTSYTFKLVVGVMTSPSDLNTFVPIDTAVFNSTTYAHYNVTFDQYTGTGSYIAIMAPKPTSGYNYGYVDNVMLDLAPSCATPTNFQVSALTHSSVDLTWTDDPNEGTWQVAVLPASASLDASQAQTVFTNTFNVSTLAANTSYKAYLRTVCSNGLGYSEWAITSFTTPCQPLATLPFSENFDSYSGTTSATASTNNLPSCWAYLNHGTSTSYSGYPIIYNNSSSAASGTNSIRFYMYTTSPAYDDQVLILPPIDATLYPMNTLMLSMDVKAISTSYNFQLVVGVMSNPADMNTFVPVQTIQTASTTYANYIIPFGQYTGTGNFIAIKAPKPTSNYNQGYIDNIVVDEMPDCSPVTDLTVSQIVGTSALISWNAGMFGTPAYYEVEYSEHGMNNWIPAASNITSTQFMLGGLDPGTSYDVRVKTTCTDNSEGDWTTKTFVTKCLAGGDVTVGNGTNTNEYTPSYSCYNYAFNEQLYTASEIGSAGMINSISFKAYTVTATPRNWAVYLMPTTLNSLSGIVNMDATTAVKVYEGSVNITQGWFTINFTTPFPYDGVSNLILAIDDNTGSYVCTNSFYCHTNPNGSTYYLYTDDSSENPNPFSATSSYASSGSSMYRANTIFGLPCDSNATCVAPNMYVSSTTTNTATVEWVPGYTEGLWSMEYKLYGDTLWTSVGNQTSSPAILTNLASGTRYMVRMRSECGGIDTSNWVAAEFSTECDAIVQLPFTENFDSYNGSTTTSVSANNLPLCWNYLNEGTNTSYSGYPMIYNYQTYAESGTNTIRFYSYSTVGTYDDQIAILPPMDVTTNPMNTLQVSFDARNQGTYTFQLVVGVMSNPHNKSTFVPVDTIVTTSNTYTSYDIPFNNYSGTGAYIALMAPRPSTSYNAGYVDNIRVDLIPTCPRPHDLAINDVSPNSVTLSWTEMGTAYNWIVEYDTAGFTPGTGSTVQVQNTPSTTVTGLQPDTRYDFYVMADCGGNDVSYYTSKVSIRTSCSAVTIPYSENFDNIGSGTNVIPGCWRSINNYSTTNYPYVSTSYHSSGNASLYFYCSTPTYNIAVLPFVDVTTNPINTLQLSFMMLSSSSTTSTITVGVMTNPIDASTFTPITQVNNTTTGTFELKEVNLSSYAGQGSYVALKLTNTSSSYSVYIDDILLETIPTCPRPTNLTATNATETSISLSWTEAGTAHDWIVEYGPMGFTQGSGTTVQVQNTPSTTITGLTASTTYDFYVKADCGGGDQSSYSLKLTASTTMTPTALPYTANFSSAGDAWVLNNGSCPNYWMRGTYSGSGALFVTNDGSTPGYTISSNSMVSAQKLLSVGTSPNITISFDVQVAGESSYDYMKMFLAPPTEQYPASTSSPTSSDYGYNTYSTYAYNFYANNYGGESSSYPNILNQVTGTIHVQAVMDNPNPNPTASSTALLVFAWRNDPSVGTQPPAIITNLTVTGSGGGPVPTCDAPTGLAVSANSITQTTATATWTAGGTETAWDLQYKLHSASDWGNTIPLTAHTYNFTGLTAGTQYDVRVRANCGSGTTSDWTNAVSFTTLSQGQDPCNDPTNLTATDVTTNSVVLDWTENGTATSWTVNYKEDAAAQWSTATANAHPYTLTGLQPETAYTAYVVANCASGQSGASNMVTFTTQTVGINDYEQAISLYPNPNNGQFIVNRVQGIVNRVQIYDVYGKLLKTVEVNANTAELDVRELSAGMYFVRVSTEKGVVTKSFVKK
ncbi:MAG: fibronectin type III domain-containing protein [Bacteroidales bacterium]|nr:fibronectin type III domain-containing protein [Bacteroidales bacterium]